MTSPSFTGEFAGTAPWWVALPDRLADELRLLDEAGIPYERDPDMEAHGIMRLRVFPRTASGEALELVAVFPDFYPFFRFEVEAPKLTLDYHQHPFQKALCLLPRGTALWRPHSDRLAAFLLEQLPKVLDASSKDAAPEAVAKEQHQAEPFSDYYLYLPPAMLMIDSAWQLDAAVGCGWFTCGLPGDALQPIVDPVIRGVVLMITDDAGRVLAEADPALIEGYPRIVQGRWVRVDEPIRLMSPTEIFRKLEALDPTAFPEKRAARISGGDHTGSVLRMRAAIYPEEVRWRGAGTTTVDAWLAAVEIAPTTQKGSRQPGSTSRAQLLASFKSAQQGAKHYLVRPGRIGRNDLLERVPELRSLQGAHIAVVGLGCLGAPSALEFARAQAGVLTLADYDLIDPGTSVRWPFGLQAAGYSKPEVLQGVIRENYPYTVTRAITWRVGGLRADKGEHEGTILRAALEGATLIYDASAEPGVRFFLSEVARDRRIPYVGVAATQGGWGGWVVRIRPDRTEGCVRCLEFSFADEPSALTHIAWPPQDQVNGGVQPVGCADPTFRATSFDVGQVSLMGVRMAVGTLTGAEPGGYPDGEWDVAVLRLRNDVGDIIPPSWTTYDLPRHPKCGICAVRIAA